MVHFKNLTNIIPTDVISNIIPTDVISNSIPTDVVSNNNNNDNHINNHNNNTTYPDKSLYEHLHTRWNPRNTKRFRPDLDSNYYYNHTGVDNSE